MQRIVARPTSWKPTSVAPQGQVPDFDAPQFLGGPAGKHGSGQSKRQQADQQQDGEHNIEETNST